MDRLDTMRGFVAVATEGGFAPAARTLRWSPSVVTRAVAALERRLGVALFTRTTRVVRLTAAGEAHLVACRRILDAIDSAEERVRGERAEPRGHLTIAAPVMFGRLHILPVAAELLAAHPALSVRLILADRLARVVDEGVDVAVRIGPLEDSAMIAVRLASVRRVTVASPAYLATRGVPATPADLADHDRIAFDNADQADDWRFAGVRLPPARLTIDSLDAALAAAEMGLGLARALSYQVVDAVAAGRLRLLGEPFASAPLPVSALYPARRIASANVAAFVAAARRRLAALPAASPDAGVSSNPSPRP